MQYTAIPAELDTKCLNLNKEFLDINYFVSDQRLKEDTDQPDESVLHISENTNEENVPDIARDILVLNGLTSGDAVGDVQVDKLSG